MKDSDIQQRRRLIVILASGMVAIALFFIPVASFFQNNSMPSLVTIGIALCVFVVVIMLARRGNVETAALLFTGFLVIAPLGAMVAGQVIGPAPFALLFSISIASVVLRPWQLVVVIVIDLVGLFGVLPFLPASELRGEFNRTVIVSSIIVLLMVALTSFINAILVRKSLAAAQQAAAEAAAANQSLAEQHQVLARTNDDLRHALQAAKSASTLKTQFVATVSHELRTPLTAIMGYTHMLRTGMYGKLPSDQHDAIDHIHFSSQHLMRLIDDILNFAELESGEQIVQTDDVSLVKLIEDTVRSCMPPVHTKGITFETVLDPALPTSICTDQRGLEKILLNLLSNAIKFTEQGHIALRVSAIPIQRYVGTSNTDALKQLVIEVEDTGVGIKAEDLDTIFEPFQRVDSHLTGSRGGTGLGLAVTHHLVMLMDGAIQVSSDLGRGSRFTVTLPLKTIERSNNREPVSEE